jgi:hypothetical protein
MGVQNAVTGGAELQSMIGTLHGFPNDLALVQRRKSVGASILQGYWAAIIETIENQGLIEQTPLKKLSGPDL